MGELLSELGTILVWAAIGAIAVGLARLGGGRLAGVWLLLYLAAFAYYNAWSGQANPKSGQRMVSAPWWLRVALLRTSTKVGFRLGLMQLAALGFAAGVLLGVTVGREDLQSLVAWGSGVAVVTAAIGALVWWSWLMMQKLE